MINKADSHTQFKRLEDIFFDCNEDIHLFFHTLRVSSLDEIKEFLSEEAVSLFKDKYEKFIDMNEALG